MIAVQIHLFSCCFSFPLPLFGLFPSGSSPAFFSSIQRRAVSWQTGGHAQNKQFKLSFSSETEPKGVPMHTHTQWVLNFVYQKKRDSVQGYSINIIHLPFGYYIFLDLKSVSLTVRSCPFLSLNEVKHVPTRKEKGTLCRTRLIACSKGRWQLWMVELLDLLISSFQTAFPHVHYHALWLQSKAIENWRKPI